tara:strand:+ start:1819 stop:2139 length:321 start_codon:yes stop_codon:yes gene_type:complete
MKKIDMSYKNMLKVIDAMEKTNVIMNNKIDVLCQYNFEIENLIAEIKEIITERSKADKKETDDCSNTMKIRISDKHIIEDLLELKYNVESEVESITSKINKLADDL